MNTETILRENPVTVALCHGMMMLFFDPMEQCWIVTKGAGQKRGIIHRGNDFQAALKEWVRSNPRLHLTGQTAPGK